MPVQAAVRHVTTYAYDRPVWLGPQLIRLRPAPHGRTLVRDYALSVEPAGHRLHWQQDPHANWLARCVLDGPTEIFRLAVEFVADLAPVNPFAFFVEPGAETWPFRYPAELERDLVPYLASEPAGLRFEAALAEIPRAPLPTVEFLVDLNRWLRRRVGYVRRLEPGVLTPDETLAMGKGSCRDSSWLLVAFLRRLGVAARFVSGYLVEIGQAEAGTTDRLELHAWAEAFVPGAGWIGLDPTSGLLCAEGHIPLAATRHPASAAPISGSVGEAKVAFDVAMRVSRLGPS